MRPGYVKDRRALESLPHRLFSWQKYATGGTIRYSSSMPISHCYAIEIFENDDRVFPEEFLRELAAAQVQHIQKLAGELKEVWGMANSARIR
jgi:hypothetical protein